LVASVISATIPSSFYAFPSAMTFTYLIDGVSSTWTTIPAGNWTIIEILNWFNTGSSGTTTATPTTAQITSTNANIALNYSPDQNVFTFVKVLTGAHTVVIPSQTTTVMNNLLGISLAKFPLTIPSSVIYADYSPQISGPLYANVLSSLATENTQAGTSPLGSGVLAYIPITSISNGINVYLPSLPVKNILKETNISSIDITIVDDSLTPMNLNGSPFALDILIELMMPQGPVYNASPTTDLYQSTMGYRPKKY